MTMLARQSSLAYGFRVIAKLKAIVAEARGKK
jgi:hypothetical protein